MSTPHTAVGKAASATAASPRSATLALSHATAARNLRATTRISLGWIFLWPFADKMFVRIRAGAAARRHPRLAWVRADGHR